MRVLHSDRLTLRWFTPRDAPFILALLNDPAWIANIGDRGVRTLDEARTWIAEKLVRSYWDKGHGLWAIERRSDGALLGMCGLLERDSLPALDVGYALAPPFRGQGYAREAALAALRYAGEALGQERLLAIVRPENRPSIRLLESLGMAPIGTHQEADGPALLLFAVGEEAPQAGEQADAGAALIALVHRFYAAFSNRQGLSRVASVPSLFLPEARVIRVDAAAARGVESLSLPDFLAPRAALLLEGRLSDFEEHEVSGHTHVVGALAHHWSRYAKTGILDGAPLGGGGQKHFTFVRTSRGWKIAALLWEEAQA